MQCAPCIHFVGLQHAHIRLHKSNAPKAMRPPCCYIGMLRNGVHASSVGLAPSLLLGLSKVKQSLHDLARGGCCARRPAARWLAGTLGGGAGAGTAHVTSRALQVQVRQPTANVRAAGDAEQWWRVHKRRCMRVLQGPGSDHGIAAGIARYCRDVAPTVLHDVAVLKELKVPAGQPGHQAAPSLLPKRPGGQAMHTCMQQLPSSAQATALNRSPEPTTSVPGTSLLPCLPASRLPATSKCKAQASLPAKALQATMLPPVPPPMLPPVPPAVL